MQCQDFSITNIFNYQQNTNIKNQNGQSLVDNNDNNSKVFTLIKSKHADEMYGIPIAVNLFELIFQFALVALIESFIAAPDSPLEICVKEPCLEFQATKGA
eukprot:TRINITY_DN2587_c0_g1_i9.p6 TRINITY_DN2587_c0_g1~~TRINITY_DN2587_c0_g1_i9.p6  ORF type:complete len:101 (+),score=8.10 TRINITY_DN2587_c0_g1_i9:120-422(+)